MIYVASNTVSGLAARWWIEKLLEVRAAEGRVDSPAFGHRDNSVMSLRELDGMLHFFWRKFRRRMNH